MLSEVIGQIIPSGPEYLNYFVPCANGIAYTQFPAILQNQIQTNGVYLDSDTFSIKTQMECDQNAQNKIINFYVITQNLDQVCSNLINIDVDPSNCSSFVSSYNTSITIQQIDGTQDTQIVKNNQNLIMNFNTLDINNIREFNIQNVQIENLSNQIVLNQLSTSTIQNSKIINNQQSFSLIKITSVNQLDLIDCEFKNNTNAAGNGGVFYIDGVPGKLEILRCSTEENQAQDIAGAFFIMNIGQFKILFSNFTENQSIIKSGAIHLINAGDITIEDSNFNQNQAGEESGGLYIENGNDMIIDRSVFSNNIVNNYGGGFLLKNLNSLVIQYSNFYANNATVWNGGGGYVDTVQGTTTITHCDFRDNKSGYYGGGLLVRNSKQNITSYNITFNNNRCDKDGGGFYISKSRLTFYNMTFHNSYAKTHGAGLFFDAVPDSEVYNMQFYWGISKEGGGIAMQDADGMVFYDLEFYHGWGTKYGGAFYYKRGKNCVYRDILVHNSSSYELGGAWNGYDIENESFKNIKLFNCSSKTGGGFNFRETFGATFDNVTIENCTAKQYGGAINIQEGGDIEMKNMVFLNNVAEKSHGGALLINTGFNNVIHDIVLENNIAQLNGGGISLLSQRDLNLYGIDFIKNQGFTGGGLYLSLIERCNLTDILFDQNEGVFGGGGSLENCENCKLQDVRFMGNNAQVNGGGLKVYKGEQFSITQAISEKNKANKIGGGMHIQYTTDFSIDNSQFKQNEAGENVGGGLFMDNMIQSVNLLTLEVIGNSALQGGGLHMQQSKQAEFQLKNLTLDQNSALKFGGAVYGEDVNKIVMEDIVVRDNQAMEKGGSFHFVKSGSIQILRNVMENSMDPVEGGFVYAEEIQDLQFADSNLTNSTSQFKGGAISIINSETIRLNKLIIKNTLSEKDEQSLGGCLYLREIKKMIIEECDIDNSISYLKGGAIYAQEINELNMINSKVLNSHTKFDSSISTFQKDQNYILSQGGALYFQTVPLQSESVKLNIQNCTFKYNQASSGGAIFLHELPSTNLDFQINSTNFQNNMGDIGGDIRYIGEMKEEVFKQQFIANKVINQQNSESLLVPKSDNSNIYIGFFQNEMRKSSESYDFVLCYPGNQLENGGQLACDKCIENGQCDGGYIPFFPKEEYWRKDSYSSELFFCEKNPEACKGNDTCKEGFTGILCENCDIMENYAKSSENNCEKCRGNKGVIILNFTVFFICVMAMIFITINGVHNKVSEKLVKRILNMLNIIFLQQTQKAAINKILVMHFQITMLTIVFQLKLPAFLMGISAIVGNPVQAYSDSIQCLFEVDDGSQVEKQQFNMSLYSILISFFCLCLIYIVISLAVLLKKLNKLHFTNTLKSALICFFLAIQPGLFKNFLKFLICRSIGEMSYNTADSNIMCDSDYYKQQVFPISLGVALIVGLFIPVYLLQDLIRAHKKKIIGSISYQRAKGILYIEYKDSKFYWEFVAMFLKLIIVCIVNLLYKEVGLRSTLLCVLLGIYSFLQLKNQPFINIQLNTLSMQSTLSQVITIMLQLCMEDENTKNLSHFTTFSTILIILINCLFLLNAAYRYVPEIFELVRLKCIGIAQKIPFLNRIVAPDDFILKTKSKMRWNRIKLGTIQFILERSQSLKQNPNKLQYYRYLKKQFRRASKVNISSARHLPIEDIEEVPTGGSNYNNNNNERSVKYIATGQIQRKPKHNVSYFSNATINKIDEEEIASHQGTFILSRDQMLNRTGSVYGNTPHHEDVGNSFNNQVKKVGVQEEEQNSSINEDQASIQEFWFQQETINNNNQTDRNASSDMTLMTTQRIKTSTKLVTDLNRIDDRNRELISPSSIGRKNNQSFGEEQTRQILREDSQEQQNKKLRPKRRSSQPSFNKKREQTQIKVTTPSCDKQNNDKQDFCYTDQLQSTRRELVQKDSNKK